MQCCIFRNRAPSFLLGLFAVLLTVLSASGGSSFPEGEVKKIAVAITNAAHPTGKKVALLKSTEPKKEGFLLIKMELEYYGAVSNNRFTADVLVEIQLSRKATEPLEIIRIDFVDNNNKVAPNQKNLKKLIDEMNARFRIEKAK